MKKKDWVIEIIKFIFTIGISWGAFICALAMLTPVEAEFSGFYAGLGLLLSLCFVFVIRLITSYSNISRLKYFAEVCHNNIGIICEKIERMEKYDVDEKKHIGLNGNTDSQKYLEAIIHSEKELADAKQKYNEAIGALNIAIRCFPANLLKLHVLKKNSDLDFYYAIEEGEKVEWIRFVLNTNLRKKI